MFKNIMTNPYVTPVMELIEVEVESAILTASGENSIPHFGE